MTDHLPLYTQRLVTLVASAAVSGFGIAAALYARDRSVKSKNNTLNTINALNLGFWIDVDISDVYNSGLAVGGSQVLIFMTSLICLFLLLFSRTGRTISNRTLTYQLGVFTFASVFGIAAVSTVSVLVAIRESKVTTLLPNGKPVPKELVQMLANEMGFEARYRKKSYLLLLAAGPAFGVLFGIISTVVTYFAWKRLRSWPQAPDSESVEEREKRLVHYNTQSSSGYTSK